MYIYSLTEDAQFLIVILFFQILSNCLFDIFIKLESEEKAVNASLGAYVNFMISLKASRIENSLSVVVRSFLSSSNVVHIGCCCSRMW